MVLEAVVSGLPVITLNHPPMNEWVRQPELLARPRWLRYPAYSSAWVEHSHLRLPDIGDLVSRISWAAEHDLEPISRANRSWGEKTFAPDILGATWERTLESLHRTPVAAPVALAAEPLSPSLALVNKVRSRIVAVTGRPVPFFGAPW